MPGCCAETWRTNNQEAAARNQRRDDWAGPGGSLGSSTGIAADSVRDKGRERNGNVNSDTKILT